MICRRQQLTVSLVAAAILVAAVTDADDSVEPERVLMTEHALSAEQVQSAQMAWADHLGFDTVVENSIGMQLCVIPPGTFPMGREYRKGQSRPHVTHSQPFFVGRFEVTQGEWKRVMGSIRSHEDYGAGDRFPVYRVNYAEAAEFCRKLTRLDREAGKLLEGSLEGSVG